MKAKCWITRKTMKVTRVVNIMGAMSGVGLVGVETTRYRSGKRAWKHISRARGEKEIRVNSTMSQGLRSIRRCSFHRPVPRTHFRP